MLCRSSSNLRDVTAELFTKRMKLAHWAYQIRFNVIGFVQRCDHGNKSLLVWKDYTLSEKLYPNSGVAKSLHSAVTPATTQSCCHFSLGSRVCCRPASRRVGSESYRDQAMPEASRSATFRNLGFPRTQEPKCYSWSSRDTTSWETCLAPASGADFWVSIYLASFWGCHGRARTTAACCHQAGNREYKRVRWGRPFEINFCT